MRKFFIYTLVSLTLFAISNPVSAFAKVPFGGRIISASPCTCSPHTRLSIQTAWGRINLDYTYFSQSYLSYNIPKTTNLKGFYRTGPSCMDYSGTSCIPRKTSIAVGTIDSMVGSSPR